MIDLTTNYELKLRILTYALIAEHFYNPSFINTLDDYFVADVSTLEHTLTTRLNNAVKQFKMLKELKKKTIKGNITTATV